ncbi:hypothetical protein E2C01_050290 [Portunus trituberculatus]|uniref:Uncharacterized protein n=1 Tax=Portunus trituberculatus TaxID=210409 RepID=A0A5B7GG41_PORTR|nr:hypothetical protein [Portunus trituberculatus]
MAPVGPHFLQMQQQHHHPVMEDSPAILRHSQQGQDVQASPSSSPRALPILFTPAALSSSSRSRRWPSSSRGSHVNKAPTPPSPFDPVPRCHYRDHHHLHHRVMLSPTER